jgi:3',5'-cyclic AMP phosphodiesterase CpdA
MFVLAHVSDPHLAPLPSPDLSELASKRLLGFLSWRLRRRKFLRRDVLDAIVRDLRSQSPDHTVVTGDLVNIALLREFANAQAWLKDLGSERDVTIVPGNHDAYVRSVEGEPVRFWGAYMRPDESELPDEDAAFPFVRRRGRIALIGLSTAVATGLFMATGYLGERQIARCGDLLARLGEQNCYRIVLIHHPAAGYRAAHKRLIDADQFQRMLKAHGAELVLSGHDHVASMNWLEGPRGRIPALGAPSASAVARGHQVPAAYNLYRIDESGGKWTCEVVSRGYQGDGGKIGELRRQMLST